MLSAGLGDPWVIYVSAFGGPPPGFRLYVSIALFSHFILRVVGTPVGESFKLPPPGFRIVVGCVRHARYST